MKKKDTNSGPQNPNAAWHCQQCTAFAKLVRQPEFRTEVHSRCFYNDNVTQVALTTSLKRGPCRGTGPPGTASGQGSVPLAMHFGPHGWRDIIYLTMKESYLNSSCRQFIYNKLPLGELQELFRRVLSENGFSSKMNKWAQ